MAFTRILRDVPNFNPHLNHLITPQGQGNLGISASKLRLISNGPCTGNEGIKVPRFLLQRSGDNPQERGALITWPGKIYLEGAKPQ